MACNFAGPSVARLLAAGQRGETLEAGAILDRCYVAVVPGKGRGLLASQDTPAGSLLLLEPALASGETHESLASELVLRVENDDALLAKVLHLCMAGKEPDDVPNDLASDPDIKAAVRRSLGVDVGEAEAYATRLRQRLESIAQGNAFRATADPLGALAWHALPPGEQRALAEHEPKKVPAPKLWLFPQASFINHSESPNAARLVAGGFIAVRSTRELKTDEEVLISYWPDVDAVDAKELGLLSSFGMTAATIGATPELGLSPEQLITLERLKRVPFTTAEKLKQDAAQGDPAAAFDAAVPALRAEISAAEKVLPKELRAFLEPRAFLAQVVLQQAAIKASRGDTAAGDTLRRLGLEQLRRSLSQFPEPWGQRLLLRILFVLNGMLRPAPLALLPGEAGTSGDFAVQLAKQARVHSSDIRAELERAVDFAFGDVALTDPVLSICGIALSESE